MGYGGGERPRRGEEKTEARNLGKKGDPANNRLTKLGGIAVFRLLLIIMLMLMLMLMLM